MTLAVLPDTRLAVITLTNLHDDLPVDVTVSGGTPDDLSGSLPWVAVFRPPSPPAPVWMRLDAALLNVQTWAATEAAAMATALTVHAILHTLPGQTCIDPPVVVREVEDVGGFGYVHDPGYPDLHRVVFTVRAVARTA